MFERLARYELTNTSLRNVQFANLRVINPVVFSRAPNTERQIDAAITIQNYYLKNY